MSRFSQISRPELWSLSLLSGGSCTSHNNSQKLVYMSNPFLCNMGYLPPAPTCSLLWTDSPIKHRPVQSAVPSVCLTNLCDDTNV